jgi:hypothetical protein
MIGVDFSGALVAGAPPRLRRPRRAAARARAGSARIHKNTRRCLRRVGNPGFAFDSPATRSSPAAPVKRSSPREVPALPGPVISLVARIGSKASPVSGALGLRAGSAGREDALPSAAEAASSADAMEIGTGLRRGRRDFGVETRACRRWALSVPDWFEPLLCAGLLASEPVPVAGEEAGAAAGVGSAAEEVPPPSELWPPSVAPAAGGTGSAAGGAAAGAGSEAEPPVPGSDVGGAAPLEGRRVSGST